MHIDDALARFLIQLEADGRSRHTIRQYTRHVRCLARWAAGGGLSGRVCDFEHEAVATFLASPEATTRPDGRRKRASSVNALRSSVRGFFAYLAAAGYLEEDPARLVRRARCGPPPPRALSEGEQAQLLAALSAAEGREERRDRALFLLMLRAGLRVGEAVGLDVEDLDLEQGEVAVRGKGEVAVRGKGGREERAVLPGEVQDALRCYLGGRASGPLFGGTRGRRISVRHAQRRFAAWLERAGVCRPASPHSLRHSFAQALYRRTGDLLLVKEALRHRSVASTMVYARADRAQIRAALEA